jgi:hypothetical protein
MATLEQIIEEARKLPIEDRQRLRAALETLDSNGDQQRPYRCHQQERAWMNRNRDEYLGQWVALEGDRLVAHGTDARQVYLAARKAGISFSPSVRRTASMLKLRLPARPILRLGWASVIVPHAMPPRTRWCAR